MTWNTAVLGGFVIVAASLVGAGAQEKEARPRNVPFYTWVRRGTGTMAPLKRCPTAVPYEARRST